MSLFLMSSLFFSIFVLLVGGFLAWLSLRLYVLHFFLICREDRIQLVLQLGSLSRNVLSVFLYNEDRKWFAGIRTPKRFLWQQSWVLSGRMHGLRVYRRIRSLWRHPQRPAWIKASRSFLSAIYEPLRCRQILINLRLGLPTYPETGYLAAVAYPLNFTLFRCLGIVRLNILPDFSTRGFTLENQIRFTFHGYQLWKPSYHFLSSPVVRHFLWNRLSGSIERLTHFRHTNR